MAKQTVREIQPVEDSRDKQNTYCAFFELDVEEIIIPQSVRTIREGSIMYCDSLKKIVIPFNTKVEDNAICDCEELVIYTQKGSSADKYAQENDIPVEYV